MNPTDVSIADSRGKLQWLTGASDRDNAAAAASAAAARNPNSNSNSAGTAAAVGKSLAAAAASASSANAGGFAAFGLDAGMLETITNSMHYTTPTPIQRKTIPLLMQGADVVAMARTGSGKSAAFIIPMIYRLREHSKLVGVRGVILSPTRELALQTLRHFKMLARHTDLKSAAMTGGDALNAQFEELALNPDVLVASPGRLLHMCEETHQNLLARVQVCVLDEADRLFEMGFQAQIVSLIKKVPEQAQRCLFSATMPTILAEFTEAGLHNPIVVRLDSETKLSHTLKHSAFVCRGEEKYGALVYLLSRLIRVKSEVVRVNQATAEPLRRRVNATAAERNRQSGRYVPGKGKKGDQKRGSNNLDDDDYDDDDGDEHYISSGKEYLENVGLQQVLVFVESKHHVEFLGEVLPTCYGISTVAIHGHLDQEARREAIATFRRRNASVLVVTDVAARGIDLPALDSVVNFSFPHEPKLFVHRVGRVARAGRDGCAYSILTWEDMPYYFDVMSFIGKKPLCRAPESITAKKQQTTATTAKQGIDVDDYDTDAANFTPDDGCYGRLPTHELQQEVDTMARLVKESFELSTLFQVTQRSHEKYSKTKKRATHSGMSAAHDEADLRYENIPVHPMLEMQLDSRVKEYHAAVQDLRKFKPKETVLDIVHGVKQFSFAQRAARGTGASTLKRLTNEILSGDQQQQQQKSIAEGAGAGGKLSLAESMAKRAAERRRREEQKDEEEEQQKSPFNSAGAVNGLLMSVRPMFGDSASAGNSSSSKPKPNKKGKAAAAASAPGWEKQEAGDDDDNDKYGSSSKHDGLSEEYRDKNFFLPNERQENIDSQHLSLRGHAMDMSAESAEDARHARNVFAWNKKKNKYVKVHVNDAKAMIKGAKNESGKAIDFKHKKLDAYRNWTKSTNMRVQDVGEPEDLTGVRKAHQARKEIEMQMTGGDKKGDDDDYDEALLADPKHQVKARMGRKMKKLPSEGRVKGFEELALEKRKKRKETEKLQRRRDGKASKKAQRAKK